MALLTDLGNDAPEEDAAAGPGTAPGTGAATPGSRFSAAILDQDESELLELVRAYLYASVIVGTVVSMACHLTGKLFISWRSHPLLNLVFAILFFNTASNFLVYLIFGLFCNGIQFY